ncbi:MAG TPA: N-acetylmuramoyl-L-alanine amidase [Pseudonocardiaceae bacterium]|nr:N-acetylmuramoyl-L-alanine amidase [Pseudonocardiaceae bacterium]
MLARRLSLVAVAAAAVAMSGCQAATPAAAPPTTTMSSAAPTTAPPTTTVPATTTQPPTGHGQVIVLDPGHNGGNASHPAQINAQVPAGRGQSKACDTTGTATNAGYTEHAFTWDVANRVQADLTAKGYRVILTRPNDTGVGPCVNDRAAIGNQAQAAAVVSIHGDGSTAATAHGFHVEYANPPLNAAQGTPSTALATALRDSGRAAGFTTANYLGTNGLFGRPDLAGLNLSTRPKALIECGNMRNANDAAMMTSPTGRQQIADFIAAGIIAYLTH